MSYKVSYIVLLVIFHLTTLDAYEFFNDFQSLSDWSAVNVKKEHSSVFAKTETSVTFNQNFSSILGSNNDTGEFSIGFLYTHSPMPSSCASLYIDLHQSNTLRKLRLGVNMCGSLSKVVANFTYQGRELEWRKTLRVSPENYQVDGFWDMLDEEDKEDVKKSKEKSIGLRMVQFIIFGNNTYKIRIGGGQGVRGSLLEDWDITGQPYVEVERIQMPKAEVVQVSSQNQTTRYDFYDSNGTRRNTSCFLVNKDRGYNQILYDTVYLHSIKSPYTTEKNRNFTLSTHEKAHFFSDLQSIRVTIEGANFILTHLLVSDQAQYAQRKLSHIQKDHKRTLQPSPKLPN